MTNFSSHIWFGLIFIFILFIIFIINSLPEKPRDKIINLDDYKIETNENFVINLNRDNIIDLDQIINDNDEIKKKCCLILEEIYNVPFNSSRPDWFRDTYGRRYELNCYNKELKIGLNYVNEDHYNSSLYEELEIDQIKMDLCRKNKITLINVPYTVKIEELKEYLMEKLRN
jgi:hypothetical protein